ncbi:hypothetical protein QUC31_012676 [Theobroma cacao]
MVRVNDVTLHYTFALSLLLSTKSSKLIHSFLFPQEKLIKALILLCCLLFCKILDVDLNRVQLLLSINGGLLKLPNGQDKTWCVAKPSSNNTALASNIDFACSQLGNLGLSCDMIKEDGICFNPNTLINHASVVMNSYYHAFGRNIWNCDFSGSALITISDPSYGSCQYP